MPKYSIVILTPAFNDIDQIADYHLMKVGTKSAAKITDKLLDMIQMLTEHPHAGAEHPDPILQKQGFRKVVCSDYICVYNVINETVFIYRIVPGATDYPRLFKP